MDIKYHYFQKALKETREEEVARKLKSNYGQELDLPVWKYNELKEKHHAEE